VPTFQGTTGNDELTGTPQDDLLFGDGGLDTLIGNAGSDELHGGEGRDFLFADRVGYDQGTDVDRLYGDEGDDVLYVGYGDRADGGPGDFDAAYISYAGSPLPISEDTSAILKGAPLMGSAVAVVNVERIGGIELSAFSDRLVVGGDLRGAEIFAGAGDDYIIGQGAGEDQPDWFGFLALGQDGNDVLLGSFNGDDLIGGAGADFLHGGAGNDELSSDLGHLADSRADIDRLYGGSGDDTLFFGWGDEVHGEGGFDTAWASFAGATNGVNADIGVILDGIERLVSLTLTDQADTVIIGTTEGGAALVDAGNGNDHIIGQNSAVHVNGGAGDDLLVGSTADDLLVGADGEDRLLGGPGSDILWGGRGADLFYITELETDTIKDFSSGEDKLDMTGLDADTTLSGHQRFSFVGSQDFSGHAGELRLQLYDGSNLGPTYALAGDIDGDGSADFLVMLGTVSVIAGDLIL
jgi:Ca2+-binding RTX toxin-like protein